jgi:oligopeptidase B
LHHRHTDRWMFVTLLSSSLSAGNEGGGGEPCYYGSLTPGNNSSIDASHVSVLYSSPITSEKNLKVCLASGEVIDATTMTDSVDRKCRELWSPNFSLTTTTHLYECYRRTSRSQDGTHVPMTIIHRRDLVRDGYRPVLMRAYGAYGHDLEMSFDHVQITLLERGWVLCYAHVRGGGEQGRSWHTRARKEAKGRSMEDLIACATWLIDQGYTQPKRLSVRGMSAGGLVCASVLVAAPDMIGGPSILAVPFVDVVNAMIDQELPLTIHETDEWGDPLADSEVFRAMLRYSPYEKMAAISSSSQWRLPPLYCTASLLDVRVPYWQPLKFVARYRQRLLKEGLSHAANCFLSLSSDGGHFGTTSSSGSHCDFHQDAIREYAFLLHFS